MINKACHVDFFGSPLLTLLLLLLLSGRPVVQVKLWDGRTGRFVSTLVGHVGAVYMVAWAPDSRLLVSASKDSTLKLWQVGRRRLRGGTDSKRGP